MKLEKPLWQVLGIDKYDNEVFVEYHLKRPDPKQWALDYYKNDDPEGVENDMFDRDPEDGCYYNRQGEPLHEMIVEYSQKQPQRGAWGIDIPYDGNHDGIKAECYLITELDVK